MLSHLSLIELQINLARYSHPGLITARIAVPSYCAVKFWCGVLPYFILFQSFCIHGMYGCMLCICPSSRNTRKQLKTLYETQCRENQADDLFTRIYRIIKATSLNTAMRTKRRPKSRQKLSCEKNGKILNGIKLNPNQLNIA